MEKRQLLILDTQKSIIIRVESRENNSSELITELNRYKMHWTLHLNEIWQRLMSTAIRFKFRGLLMEIINVNTHKW